MPEGLMPRHGSRMQAGGSKSTAAVNSRTSKGKAFKSTSPIRTRQLASTVDVDLGVDVTSAAIAALNKLSPADPGIRALPAAVHIAGFELGARSRALVRVRNVSSEAQRVYITPIDQAKDDGRYFTVQVNNAGKIAPGMSQDFHINFVADAPRYFYCSVRIVGETGEVTLPVHAYPVATAFKFPERVDFGRVPLLEPVSRLITLQSGVPIPFEWRLDVLSGHPDIDISPLQGVILPNSSAEVTVTYRPTSLSTAQAELLVHTAQHNWVPMKVRIAGSSHPGQRRDAALAAGLDEIRRIREGGPAALADGLAYAAGGGSNSNNNGAQSNQYEDGGSGMLSDDAFSHQPGFAVDSNNDSGGSPTSQWQRSEMQQLQVDQRSDNENDDENYGSEGQQRQQQQQQQQSPSFRQSPTLRPHLQVGAEAGGRQLPPTARPPRPQQRQAPDGAGGGGWDATGASAGPGAFRRTSSGGAGGATAVNAAGNQSVGMTRWLGRDSGLTVLDDKLSKYKDYQEQKLFSKLEERSRIADQLATAMHLATGAQVSRQHAVELIKAVSAGGGSGSSAANGAAAIDDYGSSGAGLDVGGNFTQIGTVKIPNKSTLQVKDVNFVLNQRPGRLLPADIKRAVNARRLQDAAATAAQNRMRGISRNSEAFDRELGVEASIIIEEADRGRSVSPGGLTIDGYGSAGFESPKSRSNSRSPSRARSRGGRSSAAGTVAGANRKGLLVRRSVVLDNPSDDGGGQPMVPGTAGAASTAVGLGGRNTIGGKGKSKPSAGPGMAPAALAASELSSSWLFPALQGVTTSQLPHLLKALLNTPDWEYLSTGFDMLDSVLNAAGATLLGSRPPASDIYYQQRHNHDFTRGLPPALAALVNASASALLDPRALRESVFLTETDAIRSSEAGREFSGGVYNWSGEKLVTASTVRKVKVLRSLLAKLQRVVQARLLRTRRDTLAIPSGGLQAMANAAHGSASSSTGTASGIVNSPVIRSALLPLSRPIIPCGVLASRAPTFFDAAGKDAWTLRADGMSRFRAAVTKHIVRNRVDKRLKMLMSKMNVAIGMAGLSVDAGTLTLADGGGGSGAQGALEATRSAVSQLVDREHRRAQIEGRETLVIARPTKAEAAAAAAVGLSTFKDQDASQGKLLFDIAPNRITRTTFPIAPLEEDDAASSSHSNNGWDLTQPLAAAVPSWFCEAAPFEIPAWPSDSAGPESSGTDAMHSYTPLQLPVAPMCQPREDTRPLREGALHETGASGLLPFPCAQSDVSNGAGDERLAAPVKAAQQLVLNRALIGGLSGMGCEGLPLRNSGAELLMSPHPSMRTLPPGAGTYASASGMVDPSTSLGEGCSVPEADPAYLLCHTTALQELESSCVVPIPSIPHTITGNRQAHASGNGVGSAIPALAGWLNSGGVVNESVNIGAGVSASAAGAFSGGAAAAAATGRARGGMGPSSSGPLDRTGYLPTAGQVLGSNMGFVSVRALQAPISSSTLAASSSASATAGAAAATSQRSAQQQRKPQPLWFAHAHTPSLSRPSPDSSLPLVTELPPLLPGQQQQADAEEGTALLRLPTDVLPLDKRTYIVPLLPPSTDPWLQQGLGEGLSLLDGPRAVDQLSDDSESDPDDDEDGHHSGSNDEHDGHGGGGGGYGSDGGSSVGSSTSAGIAAGGSGRPPSPSKSVSFAAATGAGARAGDNASRNLASAAGGGASGSGAQRRGSSGHPTGKKSSVAVRGPRMDKARTLFLPPSVAASVAAADSAAAGGAASNSRSSRLRRIGVETVTALPPSASSAAAAGPSNTETQAHRSQPPTGKPYLSPHDAALLTHSAAAVTNARTAAHWLAGATTGGSASDADGDAGTFEAGAIGSGKGVNAGISDPRRYIVMAPR